LNLLKMYRWEGNVRELKNIVIGLAIKKKNGWIGREDLKEIFSLVGLRSKRRYLSKEEVEEALQASGWNKSKAARMLNIHRRQIQRLAKRFKLDEK